MTSFVVKPREQVADNDVIMHSARASVTERSVQFESVYAQFGNTRLMKGRKTAAVSPNPFKDPELKKAHKIDKAKTRRNSITKEPQKTAENKTMFNLASKSNK